MPKLFHKINISPKICFQIISICFAAFILFCSALYPFTSDEAKAFVATHNSLTKAIADMFLTESPRFLNLIGLIGIYWGYKFKIVFCILNVFVQICVVYGLFYFVKGRKLKLNEQKDVLPFLLICIMYLFMIPSPSTTLFWIGGALNYSWAFLFCLLILCLYRFTYKNGKLKNTWFVDLFWLFIGFIAGMSNENTGPMMLGLSLCFILLCKYKKIKTPVYIYLSFLGIILGVSAMFGLGGSSERLSSFVYTFFVNASLGKKLLFSLYHFHKFLKAVYFIPVIVFWGLFLLLYDKKNIVLKKENFILSAFFFICGIVLAFVLFAAPLVAERAYFSAAIFSIISFCFLLDLLQDIYKIYFIKYITLLFLVYSLIITPFVIIPYIQIHKSFNDRDFQIDLAKKNGKKQAHTDILLIVPGPTKNLTIEYLDLVRHHSILHKDTLKKWYGIDIIVPDETNFAIVNKNPLIKRK